MISERPPEQVAASPWSPSSRWIRLLLVVLGIVAGQALLYGPSLLGRKILLPLDLLALPNVYLPATPAVAAIVPHDLTLADLVLQFETERRFVAAEYRKGNFPLWLPYQYAGAPLVWPRYSPFLLLACSTESPLILPWVELAAALVAGVGAFLFCRRALGLGFWAALFAAWSYPLTGFFVLWQGFPTSGAVYWFPWLLLAVERVVRKPGALSVAGLGGVTALVLVSGHLDVAGQTLVGAGVYALWCCRDALKKGMNAIVAWRRVGLLVAGWLLGFLLAAPHVWPLLDYVATGARMERRSSGTEERPPVGVSSLAQVVVPDIHGSSRHGSWWLEPGNQLESPAAGYAGLLAALVLAPLAWGSVRHRSFILCWVGLGALGLSWSLNVPGIVWLLRLPGLNMFSHNRLVFLTGFAIAVVAAIGIDQLWRGDVRWRRWHWAWVFLLLGFGGWCAFRWNVLPEPIATGAAATVAQGKSMGWVRTSADVALLQAGFERSYAGAVALCAVGLALWWGVSMRSRWPRAVVLGVAMLALGEIAWRARDRRAQCDEALYFPRLPLMEHIAKSEPGRMLGYGCFLPTLSQTHGLNDVRGYDSVDPSRLVDLLSMVADRQSLALPYALTQWFIPKIVVTNGRDLTLPPVLDMLGVRYLIFGGSPPPQITPPIAGGGYWALFNARALPRVFVPSRVEVAANWTDRLKRLGADEFDPRRVALVEAAAALVAAGRGEGRVVAENPNHVVISARMETAGLLVLGDAWNEGWQATVNGAPAAVLCVNHYLRGVVVPAGESAVEFRYRPRGVVGGFILAGIGAATLLGCVAWSVAGARASRPQ